MSTFRDRSGTPAYHVLQHQGLSASSREALVTLVLRDYLAERSPGASEKVVAAARSGLSLSTRCPACCFALQLDGAAIVEDNGTPLIGICRYRQEGRVVSISLRHDSSWSRLLRVIDIGHSLAIANRSEGLPGFEASLWASPCTVAVLHKAVGSY